MQLYTINATPERYDATESENVKRHAGYARYVSEALDNFGISGFTMVEAVGYWENTREKSYIITVASDNVKNVELVCDMLRLQYNQDAVMLTYPDNSVKFIDGSDK